MIDYTKLLDKLNPESQIGGNPGLRLRAGVVTAVDTSNSTATILIIGTVIPDVPILNGVSLDVGMVVQVLSHRGGLLIIGYSDGRAANTVPGYWRYLESTGDLALTSNTTLTDIPNMAFVVPPLTKMRVSVRFSVSGPPAAGGKIGISVSGGTTTAERTVSAAATPSAGTNDTTQMVNSMANIGASKVFGIPSNFTRYTEEAVFRNSHSTNASTIQYRFAQFVSTASPSTVHGGTGSTLDIRTVGSNLTVDSEA